MTQYVEEELSIIFDQNEYFSHEDSKLHIASKIADTVLQISRVVIDFASIERVPRYCKFKRENDAEHSFMLALAGIEIATRYYPGLDSGLVAGLALVHDFPELETGDVATFDISDDQLRQKHINEQAKLPQLLGRLPAHIGDLLVIYEEQTTPEAKFVKHTDKLLPNAVNIAGDGVKVMHEDYDVYTKQQYLQKNTLLEERFRRTFDDDLHEPLHLAHTVLADQFASHMTGS
jgi:putative hydrolase of HD superfamily